MKRACQKNLQDPLADLTLQGAIKDGDTVKVSANAEGLVINGAAVKKAA